MRNTFIAIITLAFLNTILMGCARIQIEGALNSYQEVRGSIKLGDRLENVIPKLNQAMQTLSLYQMKQPEQYLKKGVRVEIHYARSGWQSDGLTTDDEFTPYIFNNGILVGIGWTLLGGAKSTGKVVPRTTIDNTVIVR